MVNTDDFIKRLEVLLEYYSLSASLFADKVGVQRSGLSHLLSGRNKPSLDFVMKIVENFPEVDLYWLLNGTGSFPKKDGEEDVVPTSTNKPSSLPLTAPEKNESTIGDLFSQPEKENEKTASAPQQEFRIASSEKRTEKIVILYSDGTFKEYFRGD